MTPLLSPLRFFAIRHGWWVRYNLVLPGILAAGATAAIIYWPNVGPLLGEHGLLAQLNSPLAILGGFFIAALTLVTSDRSEIMKAPVGGVDPPKLDNEPLSRRRFLAFLFGYLAFSSFALAGIVMGAGLFGPGVRQLVPVASLLAVKATFVALLSFWLAHLGVATLLGLYYFTERLQVSDRRISIGKPDATATPAE